MNRLFAFLALPALLCAVPAAAQSTYPTAAGGRVAGVVALQCDTNGANCAPVTTANPAGPNQVVGNIAEGATDSGNPVKIGAVARNSTGAVENYTDGQRTELQATPTGAIYVAPAGVAIAVDTAGAAGFFATPNYAQEATRYVQGVSPQVYSGSAMVTMRGEANGLVTQPALSATFWQYAAVSGGIVSSTADVAVKAAAGASVRNFVCTLDITHATLSAASEIVVKDGATVLWRGLLQTTATDSGAGAGKLIFSPCLRGTANTAVNVAMITSVTGGVYVNVSGYTGS